MLDSQYAQTQSLAAEETIARATPKTKRTRDTSAHSGLIEDILAHIALIVIAATVLFPVVWIVSMSLDGRNISRPTSLAIIPPNPSLDAYRRVLTEPQANNVMFSTMLKNSLLLSIGVSLVVVVFAVTAAYAFARFHFPGRKWGLFLFIAVLMLPSVATLAPLFVLLSQIKIPGSTESVRSTLFGVGIAYTSGALPFAIWNLRGYIDTLPKELEESALVDGATRLQTFRIIVLPVVRGGLFATAVFTFVFAWNDFIFALVLTRNAATTFPVQVTHYFGGQSNFWAKIAAMSTLGTVPIFIAVAMLQKFLVRGVSMGAVKG
ncbi:MAG: carbohydrate ABC transporter permease [Thermomicrobiales bacterium]|nr:carbohydrate ABC transporter permease [Thermomicrobiales bacterium]